MKLGTKNTSGFSILMAIGTIAVLLVIVSSLAITYMRESKLSRFSYNEVLVSTAAEGAFEYGMLKVNNHRDGFQDTVSPVEPDGKMLELSTLRSKGLETEYSIVASSTGKIFTLSGSEHLIIPLFVSNETIISALGIQSKNPEFQTGTDNTSNFNVSGIPLMTWSIIAMSGSENIALTGTGNINSSTTGLIRIKTSQCYAVLDGSPKLCSLFLPGDEEVLYAYDEEMSVADFLLHKKDPYFILYNSNISTPVQVDISSTKPFSLPTVTLTAKSNKAESSEVYQFIENKAKYYDALKYGIYNNP